MIEVRFFAYFRTDRGKMAMVEASLFPTIASILEHFSIEQKSVAIMLVNGMHVRPDQEVKAGDIVSLFPPVAGG